MLLSSGFLLSALGLTLYHLYTFLNLDDNIIPEGVTLGGVPAGGLTKEQAIDRLQMVYLSPITLDYTGNEIQLRPADVDFQISGETMLSQIAQIDVRFWHTLLGRQPSPTPQDIPLQATYSSQKIRLFLSDISNRYDEPVFAPWADHVRLVTFVSPPGYRIDVEASLPLAEAALLDGTNRAASLIAMYLTPDTPTLDILEQQLIDFLTLKDFQGLFSLYLVDLESSKRLHFNILNGKYIPNNPDVAYSGMSIMKITILAEFYRQTTGGALPYELDLVKKAVSESSNWTSNLLIEWIGDMSASNGLYRLNNTLAELGLENSFMGGMYDTNEPPGFRYTPANTRTDVNTYPDPYMQTTSSDIGQLLEGIYRCAHLEDGLLIETFAGQYTTEECLDMLDWLMENRIGVLIEAGVPEGTPVAHKHGWAEGEPIGDAAVVFTPGANYVLVYYVWQPEYTYWDVNSTILADISRATYNHFNPVTP